jgi:hypothetical protein
MIYMIILILMIFIYFDYSVLQLYCLLFDLSFFSLLNEMLRASA